MLGYRPFVEELKTLATVVHREADPDWKQRVNQALDGQASRELRRVVAIATLRSSGAFFTSSALSDKLVRNRRKLGVRLDPTCGAGNLLIATARRLPLKQTFLETIDSWSSQLSGFDLDEEFIAATKWRLLLLARLRTGNVDAHLPDVSKIFPQIRIANAFEETTAYAAASNIFLNPPFTAIPAPVGCHWTSGSVNSAALFVQHALAHASHDTVIDAILPDVLRTGSRYEKWRLLIQNNTQVLAVEPHGLFDEKTDVDVFILRLRIKKKRIERRRNNWLADSLPSDRTVGNKFVVRVGTVVPHRDAKRGLKCPYITVHDAPAWRTHSLGQQDT